MQTNTLNHALSPRDKAENLTELWSPQVIAEMDDHYVKVAKLKGTLAWHSHEQEDELFFILKGSLKIEYKNDTVDLNKGDLHVVPRGVLHNPIAQDECLVMLIEKKSTLHTGETATDKTKNISDQLAGFDPGSAKPGKL